MAARRKRSYSSRLVFYPLLLAACVFAAVSYYAAKKRLPLQPAAPAPVSFCAKIGHKPVYNILRDHGVREPQLSAIGGKLKTLANPRSFKPDDSYTILFSTSGAFLRLAITHGLDIYAVAGLEDGRLAAYKNRVSVAEKRETFSGAIKSSLWESMISKGLSPQLIMEYADVFAWQVDFLTESRDGDAYAVIVDTKRAADGRLLGQTIAAALYDGEETGAKRAFLYKGEYYNQLGETSKRMFLRAPLTYRRISSYFTLRRYHPILRIFRPHLGIDYAAPSGTPVSSVAAGTVIFAGRNGGFGNLLKVRHSSGYITFYGHLSRYARGIRRGAHVSQGQVIAYVGMTGMATGPHLDFRIEQNNKFINFLKIKSRSAGDMDRRLLPEFKKASAPLEAALEAVLQN